MDTSSLLIYMKLQKLDAYDQSMLCITHAWNLQMGDSMLPI